MDNWLILNVQMYQKINSNLLILFECKKKINLKITKPEII